MEHLKQEVWPITAHSWPSLDLHLEPPRGGAVLSCAKSFQSFWALEGLWQEKRVFSPFHLGTVLGREQTLSLMPRRARLLRREMQGQCPRTSKGGARQNQAVVAVELSVSIAV